VADKVAKDLNTYFGNIGRQGWFKGATERDLMRMIFLAPQWVESMLKSEAGGFGQLAKAPFTGKVGSLGKGMATGIGAYFVASQILNMITRGHPTWENEEEGHKLDAYIPDVFGKSPGFFLSPLSVPAEITHDALRYAHSKEDSREVLSQIVRNKLSGPGRAASTVYTGRNYADVKLGNPWEVVKEAAISLAPIPIPASGFIKGGYPGQTQRQLFGSAGVKIEPAETAMQQIRHKAARFLDAAGKPHDTETVYQANSPYSNLRLGLRGKDKEVIAKAIEELRKNRSDEQIQKAMIRSVNLPMTGNRTLERQFLDQLSKKEQKLYDRALEERKQNLELFLQVWEKRK
jgi:hypothetical protein